MLSYSRRDEVVVKMLVQGLEAARREVWHDSDLGGGDVWWDSILAAIRTSTVFLFALSNSALQSKPCRLELDYALALHRPILPVQVGRVTALRASPLAELQIITYKPDKAESGFAVLAAVEEAERRVQPLPDPLPPPPPIPFAYLLALGRQIENSELPVDEQGAAVDQLRLALGEETDDSVRQDILAVLRNLKTKPWITKRTERDIAALLYAHAEAQDEDLDQTVSAAPPASAREPGRTGTQSEPAPSQAPGGSAPTTPTTSSAEPEPESRIVEPPPAGEPSSAGQPRPAGEPPPAGQPPPAGEAAAAAAAAQASAEPASGKSSELNPPDWFAERLEQAHQQRADQERAVDPDPPPWRMAPDALRLWKDKFSSGPPDGTGGQGDGGQGDGGQGTGAQGAGGQTAGEPPATSFSTTAPSQAGARSQVPGPPHTAGPWWGSSTPPGGRPGEPPPSGRPADAQRPPGAQPADEPPAASGAPSAAPAGQPFSWRPEARTGQQAASSAREQNADSSAAAPPRQAGRRHRTGARRSSLPAAVWVVAGIVLIVLILALSAL